jgi:hypothetical protein
LNKDVLDNVLHTYLEISIAADHVRIIVFSDNPFFQARGNVDGIVPFALEFGVLTS